jgi:hypothetical protein
MNCAEPIDAAVLADYWLGALGGQEEEAVELHLLECDACGERLREGIALADGIRKVAREGSLVMVVSDAFLKHATEQGMKVREYAPPRGGSIDCTVALDDDLLIGALTTDLSGAKRVDLAFCDAGGVEHHRLADIPFRPEAETVRFQQSITYAKAAPSETMMARVIGFNEAGAEQVLGEFTFNHARTIPGPAGR